MADLYTTQQTARRQLYALLTGGNVHATIEEAVFGLTLRQVGLKPEKVPYSIFQLLDHIRIVQWDILKICTNPEHTSPKWPEGFWHKRAAPKDEEEWLECIDQLYTDRQKFLDLIMDEDQDLFDSFENEEDQTLFKNALWLADHTSYHIGQIILVRRLLNAWS